MTAILNPVKWTVMTNQRARAQSQFEYMGYRRGRIVGGDVKVHYAFHREMMGAAIAAHYVECHGTSVRTAKAKARAMRRAKAA